MSPFLQASAEKGALLGYMPNVYMEVVMDVMNTLCKVRCGYICSSVTCHRVHGSCDG